MAKNLGKLESASEDIRQLLEIDKPKDVITNKLINSLKRPIALFSEKGPCRSMRTDPYPDKYFIAQEFNNNKDDLRNSIERALQKFGFTSIAANDFYLPDKLLCKISALIQGTPFGVYQLTASQNRNVYLELGIAIGLGKPFVLVKDTDAIAVKLIEDVEYYQINNYLDLQYELGGLLEKYITSIGKPKILEFLPDHLSNTVVIYHGEKESIDITVFAAKQMKNFGLAPVILGKFQEKLARYLLNEASIEPKFIQERDKIFEAIQKSKFGIFRVHKSASADNFVALGLSIALNKPFLPIKQASETVPSDLSYLAPLEYSSFTNLEEQLELQFDGWLSTIGE